MTPRSSLFSPIRLGPVQLENRIMVSPMCQYSAINGNPVDWHYVHLGPLAISGVGLLCLEATAVSAAGRITPGCLGLYSDENQEQLGKLVRHLRSVSTTPIAIQLGHAGRKASSHTPWEGGSLISIEEGGWSPIAPSGVPQKPNEPAPVTMEQEDINRVVQEFSQATLRAKSLGFDAIELHMAHGYLMHQFMSPLSNARSDEYGGSFENRIRLPLQVFRAVLEAAGPTIPVGVRLSATDWVEHGWDVGQTVELSKRLESAGCSFLDISSGGLSHLQKIPIRTGYQVPFAEAVKCEVKIPVISVGLITTGAQAQQILTEGRADMIAIGRAFLHDPRWPWRAAAELGGKVQAPKQLLRSLPRGHAQIFGDVQIGQR
jgi:2,4-dienoyl-CoA reductase-like NADH-dependent reductase (Old Yellow Enzyme family)